MRKCTDDREQKKLLLNILIYFNNLCSAYDLNYTLYAGTLLGAVRHKGFIPWDDDIDVLMPWPDYLKFLRLPEINDLQSRYVLHNSKTEKMNQEHYYYPFAKLEDTKTKIEYQYAYENGGLYLDVFPLTAYPTNSKDIKKMTDKVSRYKNLLVNSYQKELKNDFLRNWRNRYCNRHYRKYRDGIEQVLMELGYDSSPELGHIAWPNGRADLISEHFPREWVSKYVEVDFEGHKLQAIAEYEKLLELEYGDWKKLPPKEERINKHLFDLYIK